MDWVTGIQRAVDYVEAHLLEPISFEEAAKQAYSSSFHFQRVFSILCGYTLGDYIRWRRLSLAGVALASMDCKVIAIANLAAVADLSICPCTFRFCCAASSAAGSTA